MSEESCISPREFEVVKQSALQTGAAISKIMLTLDELKKCFTKSEMCEEVIEGVVKQQREIELYQQKVQIKLVELRTDSKHTKDELEKVVCFIDKIKMRCFWFAVSFFFGCGGTALIGYLGYREIIRQTLGVMP